MGEPETAKNEFADLRHAISQEDGAVGIRRKGGDCEGRILIRSHHSEIERACGQKQKHNKKTNS